MKSLRKLQTPAELLHSLSSNLQEATAHVTPLLGAVAATSEFVHAVGVEGQSMLHASVTSGELLHGGLAGSLLPLASVLNAAFEFSLGLSKIALALTEDDIFISQGKRRRSQLVMRGVWEMAGSIAPGIIGYYALASASAPLACLSFAVSNYTKAITKLYDSLKSGDSKKPAILSAIDGTGWLLLSFGVPAGGVLLAASFLAKRYLSTGTLTQNLKKDAARLSTWCSTFSSQTSTNASEDRPLLRGKGITNFRPVC